MAGGGRGATGGSGGAGGSGSVGRAQGVGHPFPGSSLLGGSRLHRQTVGQVVHEVAGVALDPPEAHVTPPAHLVDERLPQIAVGDRLAGFVQPTPGQPALPPAVAETVHDIGGVAHHLQVPGKGAHGLEGGLDLHALVGAGRFGAAGEGAVLHRPRPTSGAGVPETGAVGVRAGAHAERPYR